MDHIPEQKVLKSMVLGMIILIKQIINIDESI